MNTGNALMISRVPSQSRLRIAPMTGRAATDAYVHITNQSPLRAHNQPRERALQHAIVLVVALEVHVHPCDVQRAVDRGRAELQVARKRPVGVEGDQPDRRRDQEAEERGRQEGAEEADHLQREQHHVGQLKPCGVARSHHRRSLHERVDERSEGTAPPQTQRPRPATKGEEIAQGAHGGRLGFLHSPPAGRRKAGGSHESGAVALARVKDAEEGRDAVFGQLQVGADQLERVRRRVAPLVKVLVEALSANRIEPEHCAWPVQARQQPRSAARRLAARVVDLEVEALQQSHAPLEPVVPLRLRPPHHTLVPLCHHALPAGDSAHVASLEECDHLLDRARPEDSASVGGERVLAARVGRVCAEEPLVRVNLLVVAPLEQHCEPRAVRAALDGVGNEDL
eukprot:2401164-Prymnesium_polylepis.1